MPDRGDGDTPNPERLLSPDGCFAIVRAESSAARSHPSRQSVQSADGKEVVFAPAWGEFEYLPDGRLIYTVALRQGGRRAVRYRFQIDPARRAFCAASAESDWRPLPQLTAMLAHDHAQPWRIDLSSRAGRGWTLAALLVSAGCLAAVIWIPQTEVEEVSHTFLLGLCTLLLGLSAGACWNAWRS